MCVDTDERQMSQSLKQALFEATRVLSDAHIAEARLQAGALLANLLDQDRTFLITNPEITLTDEQLSCFQERIRRRAAGEPLQYISGIQEFFGLSFEVNPSALIPRPETELLVETALGLIEAQNAGPLFLDIGTGTGCIAIAILHERPSAQAVALDLSPAALELAIRNARRHSVRDRIRFVAADSLSAFERQEEFDLVVSNPPYIADSSWPTLQPEVRDHEPPLALTSGSDGLTMIRRLLREVPPVLVKRGYFVFEIGFDQAAEITEIIDKAVWKMIAIHSDLQQIPRTVVLQKR